MIRINFLVGCNIEFLNPDYAFGIVRKENFSIKSSARALKRSNSELFQVSKCEQMLESAVADKVE